MENIKKRLSPVPISSEAAYGWAKGLDIPRGGETVLYTGLLYQLVPYINSLVRYLEELERGRGRLLKIGRLASKIIDVTKLFTKVSDDEVKKQHDIIRSIALLLKNQGIEYGYLYEDELYSGVLLYDLGLDDVFSEHASKVVEKFKKYDVKNVITIDPHTNYVLKKVYPEFISNTKFKVKNYLEILYELDPKPNKLINDKIVIHDPCFYTRHDNIIIPQRDLLMKAGVEIVEPRRTRELTYCCGGPIESISPKLSREIAKMRVNELRKLSNEILVMCPLCYANLKRVSDDDIDIIDISYHLFHAYG